MSGLNLKKNFLVISCDCDTDDDAKAVGVVDSFFQELGIPVTYAAPSAVLQRNLSTFFSVVSQGRDLMNHGYRDHVSQTDAGRFINSLIYSKMNYDEIRQDFVNAHYFLLNTFNYVPRIWRTPHFGEYRKRSQLLNVYKLCNEFNYQISSSTTGFEDFLGSNFKKQGAVLEFPLTGYGAAGFGVLDSWSFRTYNQSEESIDARRFFEEFQKLTNRFNGINSVFHLYFDPRHIVNSRDFWIKLEKISTNYTPISLQSFSEELEF